MYLGLPAGHAGDRLEVAGRCLCLAARLARLVMAQLLQHTSGGDDVQLHVDNAIAVRSRSHSGSDPVRQSVRLPLHGARPHDLCNPTI